MSSPSNWQFDVLAPVYDWLSDGSLVNRPWNLLFDQLDIDNGQTILDLGGGTGLLREEVEERFSGSDVSVVTLDYNMKMLRKGTDKFERPLLVRGDALKLPFPNRRFDRVFIGDALHHMSDPEQVMKEVQRVLLPHGYLLVEEFDPSRLFGRFLYYFETLTAMGSSFYTPEELSRMISESGLRLDGHWNSGSTYYVRATTF